MKQWPEDNKTVDFSELVDSVRDCINYHYTLTRQQPFVLIQRVPLTGEADL